MTERFLKPYASSPLVIRVRTRNLFWIQVFFSLSMVVLGILTALNRDPVLPWVALVVFVGFITGLVLLSRGFYHAAAIIAFSVMVFSAISTAWVGRSGLLEGDLYRTIVLFALVLAITSSFGYTPSFGVVTGILAVATMLFVVYGPPVTDLLYVTIAQANADTSPATLIVLMVMLGGMLVFNFVQSGRLLGNLQAASDEISRHNASLEQTVADRTAALRNLMDNTGQGFLTFGADFVVEPEYSAGCRTIFNMDVAGQRIDALLFPAGSEMAQEFVQGLELYFRGMSKAAVIFDLLEKSAFINQRYLTVEYREAGRQRILCIISDVTSAKILKERNRKENERQQILFRALNNKLFFAEFLQEAEHLFASLEECTRKAPDKHALEVLLRHVHTFKGNAGFFGFQITQEVAHDFEFALSDSLILATEIPFKESAMDLKKSYYQDLAAITDTMGKDWLESAGGIVIPRPHYDRIAHYVRSKYRHETRLIHYLEHFRKLPLRELFARFPFIAAATAEKLGKKINPLELEGGAMRVVPERFAGLAEACVHLVNNMVDHGIEFGYEREAHGKAPAGNLGIRILSEGNVLHLRFTDDGRGIDVDEVVRIAKERQLVQPDAVLDEATALQFLFCDGFSTRSEVSEVSGRGVGLAAVREEVDKLGGTITVSTSPGKGSSFTISLPVRSMASRQHSIPSPVERRKQ